MLCCAVLKAPLVEQPRLLGGFVRANRRAFPTLRVSSGSATPLLGEADVPAEAQNLMAQYVAEMSFSTADREPSLSRLGIRFVS
jgi:hypothetical protein